jgi:hypothetical protein
MTTMSKKKKLLCGYRECGSEIEANSGGFEVIFKSIESTNPPQPAFLKRVNIYLCHKHTYEVAAAVRLFDKK